MEYQREEAARQGPNFSSSVSAPQKELTQLDSLQNARILQPQPHVTVERLRKDVPNTEEEALSQSAGFLADLDNPVTRSLLIDALRLGDLPQLRFEKVRAKALEALQPFNSEKDVVSVCVEEFQVNSRSACCCEAARSTIEGVDISKYPQAESVCRGIIQEAAAAAFKRAEISPGLSGAMSTMTGSQRKELEQVLINSAKASYDNQESGQQSLYLLARLGTPSAVAFLNEMARHGLPPSRTAPERDTYDYKIDDVMPYLRAAKFVGVGGGAILGGIVASCLFGGQWYIGLSGIGAGSVLTRLVLRRYSLEDWVLGFKLRPSWNTQMRNEALDALFSMLPHAAAEAAIARMPASVLASVLPERLADALGSGSSPESFRAIKKGLLLDEREMRATYVKALAKRKEPEAEELLQTLKGDNDPQIRKLAILLLRARESRESLK